MHGLDNGAQTIADQGEIASVVHLRRDTEVAVSNLREHLLDIGYVVVQAFHGGAQRLCQYFQFIFGADRCHCGVQVTVGERHYA